MDWVKAARDNLIPLSQKQDDVKVALAEWHHTGVVHDYGMPIETCQLCRKESLRYHFEILNSKTENTLLVGSKCIERFDIAVYGEGGKLLEGKDKTKKLQDEITALKREKTVQILRDLWQAADKKNRSFVETCARKIKNADGLSPKEVLLLFNLLTQHEISFDPLSYKITLRADRHKDQLLVMSEQDRNIVWEALTDKQRVAFYKYKEAVEQVEAERQEALKRLAGHKQQLEQRQATKSAPTTGVNVARFSSANFNRSHQDEEQRKISGLLQELVTSQTGAKEAECELCGQITRQWYVYDNKTGKCKCMDCYRRQQGRK